MEMIVGWLVLSIVIGVAASKLGRGSGSWFMLSLLTSPLIAGLLLIAFGRVQVPYRPDGMLGQTPFRIMPDGEVEAMLHGAPVRFRNLAEMKLMVDPNAKAVTIVSPPPPKDQFNVVVLIILAVVALALIASFWA